MVISKETCAAIIALHKNGLTGKSIAATKIAPQSTIYRIIKNFKERASIVVKKAPGRPRKTSKRQDRILKQFQLRDRTTSSAELAQEWQQAGVSASARTVRRRLFEQGLVSRRAAKKPLLFRKNIRDRLIFCKRYREWTAEDWGKVIFSDESPFRLFGTSGKQLIRRRRGFLSPLSGGAVMGSEKHCYRLDYSGIALLIMGSFVPWLYYSFYCSPQPRLIYLSIVCVLGITAIVVAQWDRFATPKHRPTRAGVFLGLGLSGIVPTLHFTIAEGFVKATTVGQMGWFFLMAVMYITGAGLYAARIPERFFPGKFDIWFQSHQIFHVLVVAAAFIHFYGVSNLQEFRYGLEGGCTDDSLL
ncbi:unnamed protein product [Ranitomeya imitator]|uniref:Transposase Tc1-like domain-containing protein n=1 Tax=Ranitomeya imitator TaxID=111125 RepID=A0ABN9LNR5_9NEOB|nr:unnamed protein product [Ranitomeya imitator]